MLNQDTKRKIDSARQILVGKVPDPKAQVEQITTALIYKFMDDMDKEAQELGGKARFFTNGYEKYAWTKLMDTRVGGQDRLNLYVEAITTLSQNPHLPQLFRDIFKDAFLPYRDPETLNLFLKELNSFTYSHSEDLGDAFEYLLSVLNSQGDAGQFRTARHIIDFIVEIVDPKKEETILDPACGTAGFLISAYKHILKQNHNKPLTPDEKKKLMQNLVGYDISPDMVRLSRVNMYLHGFPEPKIDEYDTLTSEDKWDETFDVIMANPPFMTPKGGIRPHLRFSVKVNRSEILFVDYIIDHINARGRAGIIVPVGVVFQNKETYRQIRKRLVDENLLWAVAALPGGVFNPYSDAETSILFVDKKLASKTDNILFLTIKNDGYNLGNTREKIDEDDIPNVSKQLVDYKDKLSNGDSFNIDNGYSKLVKKDDIRANNYLLVGDRYGLSSNSYKNNLVQLSSILKRNKTPIIIQDNKTYKRAKIKLYGNGIEIRDEVSGSKINTKRQFTIKTSQLLLSKIDARNGAFGIVPKDLEGAVITGNFWAYDIVSNKVDKDYLSYLLTSKRFYSICKEASSGVTNRKYLNEVKFLSMHIDLPDINIQKSIIKELNSYKKEISKLNNKLNEKMKEIWGE